MNHPASAVNPAALPALPELVLQRSVELVIGQSRLGCVTAIVVSLLLGTVFVPEVGWPSFGLWFGVVATGFVTRQVWFERLRKTAVVSADQLTRITVASAFTGWLVVLCMPLFAPQLSQDAAAFVFALMISWIAAAVAVLGVQPRVYGAYLCVTLPTALYPMTSHASVPPVLLLAMVLGGYMMFRLSVGIRALLEEAVTTGQRSEWLAQDLERAMRQQKAAFVARSRFLAAASHDLRQPVHALSLLVNVLKKTRDAQRHEEVVSEIERTSHSIQSMFRSLLEMAQIDADSMHARVERVDLQPLLQSVLAGYADRCREKGFYLQTRGIEACVVQADAMLLERVLRNLLDNAVKYTRQGHVALTMETRGERVEVAISDTGVGMSEEDLDNLYQPFHRGQSSRGSGTDGLGLGLAIARHMVELMGAELHIAAAPHQGTTATVSLLTASLLEPSTRPNVPASLLAGLQVLLVEDDAAARLALSLWLQESGANVLALSNGQEALDQLARAASHAPDLLLADYTLDPGPDGLAVISAWRKQHPSLPAVLVTGEDEVPNLPDALPVLKKPVPPQALVSALQSLLPQRPHDHEPGPPPHR